MRSKRTVVTYGTFDLLHVGHVRLLSRARALGDELFVGLSSDEFNAIKGKRCSHPYAARKEILESLRYVDKVFEESSWEQKRDDLVRFGAAVFVMGNDWAGKFDDLGDLCEVIYLPRTEGISTTQIKNALAGARPG